MIRTELYISNPIVMPHQLWGVEENNLSHKHMVACHKNRKKRKKRN